MSTTEQAMKEAKSWGVSSHTELIALLYASHYEASVGRAQGASMEDLAKDNEAED